MDLYLFVVLVQVILIVLGGWWWLVTSLQREQIQNKNMVSNTMKGAAVRMEN